MKCTVTYSIITEESAQQGDVAENGVIGTFDNLRDGVKALFETRTNEVGGCSVQDFGGWISVQNGMEFLTGNYEERCLHLPRTVSAYSYDRLCRLLGARS